MTEPEARQWLAERYPDRFHLIQDFVDLLRIEAVRQNLISDSTVDLIWSRHVVDSAQLLDHSPAVAGNWLDVGTGAGFPGLIVGILSDFTVTLVEPRRLRVEFLRDCIDRLALSNVNVFSGKVQNLAAAPFRIVSARAVMSVESLFAATRHVISDRTSYILPRGRSAEADLDVVRRSWQGVFHVEHSIVGENNGIIVAEKVRRK